MTKGSGAVARKKAARRSERRASMQARYSHAMFGFRPLGIAATVIIGTMIMHIVACASVQRSMGTATIGGIPLRFRASVTLDRMPSGDSSERGPRFFVRVTRGDRSSIPIDIEIVRAAIERPASPAIELGELRRWVALDRSVMDYSVDVPGEWRLEERYQAMISLRSGDERCEVHLPEDYVRAVY